MVFKKGHIPWTTGRPAWNRGKKWPEEVRRKISKATIGKKRPYVSERQRGSKNHRYGKRLTDKEKLVISQANRGENNAMWKDDDVKNAALHERIRRRLPQPALCEMCNKVPPYDLINVSGVYNMDLTNWQYACRRCHMLTDGRMKNLKQFQGGDLKVLTIRPGVRG
jgi:hypothetical protein